MNKIHIEIDGNDGTGKSYLIAMIKYEFPECEFKDRGIFTKLTDMDIEDISPYLDSNTLYIIIDDTIENCQKKILNRGDSLEEKYHTKQSLYYYKHMFIELVYTAWRHNVNNVVYINIDLVKNEFINIVKSYIKSFINNLKNE